MDYVIDLLDKPVCGVLTKSHGEIIFEYPNEKVWNPFGISLKNRQEDSGGFLKRVDRALQPESLSKYIVPVDPSAPTRCIDGRVTVGWEDFSVKQKNRLGPKIAGGTVHAALTHRIVDINNFSEGLKIEHDIEHVVARYKEIGIGFGGHVDTHEHGWNTGCGAVDNINFILDRLQLPEPQEQLRSLTKLVMGDAYEGSHMVNEVIGCMLFLDAIKPVYLPREDDRPDGEFLYKKAVVDLLRKQSKHQQEPVPQLAGEHAEVAIVLNFAQGTTLNTDKFSFDSNGEIQVFGWDVWEIYEEAARLYSYSMYDAPEVQQQAVTNRLKHITTRVLLGIATTMVLTDGSLKVVTIRSKKEAPALA